MNIEHGWDGTVPKRALTRRVYYQANHRSFGAFILSDQVRDPTEAVAADIAALAGILAPKRKGKGVVPEGAAMADRFKVKRDAGVIKVDRAFRVKVEVFNDARSAAPNEFGSKRNKRYRMLGRAGAAFGDFKPDGGLGA